MCCQSDHLNVISNVNKNNLIQKRFIHYEFAAAAKSHQSCLTLCDHIDSSPQGTPVPGILKARTRVGCRFLLQCVKVKSLSRVQLVATQWTTAHQAPPSKGFSRQEYWSGAPLPSPI